MLMVDYSDHARRISRCTPLLGNKENQMVRKITLILSALTLLLALGAINIFAEDDDETSTPCPLVYDADSDTWTSAYFCDGRLNAFELLQSVAVYYEYTAVPVWVEITGEDDATVWEQQMTEVVDAITVWAIDVNGVGQKALSVPYSAVSAAIAAGTDAVIAQGDGVELGVSSDGALWVTGPDGYHFTWDI